MVGMTPLLGLALGYALGIDLRRLALLAATVYLPAVVALLVVWIWWRARSVGDERAMLFCDGVASELRAGATLGGALRTAASAVGPDIDRIVGEGSTDLAEWVASKFPGIAQELRLVIRNASRGGTDAAALFDEVGSLAIAQSELRREVRMATAPGKATALVLIAAPVLYVLTQLGGINRLIGTPEQRMVAILGLSLFAVGLIIAVVVVWRAMR
jgi:Flp pilus assembly protein TadB